MENRITCEPLTLGPALTYGVSPKSLTAAQGAGTLVIVVSAVTAEAAASETHVTRSIPHSQQEAGCFWNPPTEPPDPGMKGGTMGNPRRH